MANVSAALRETDNTAFAIAMSNIVFARHESVGFGALSEAEQTAYCLDCLEREINNGGFDQFFGNSSGDTALETIAALEGLGAAHTAELVRRAVSPFPDARPSPDRRARAAQMVALPDSARQLWAELDGAFFRYRDDLAHLLRNYVIAHEKDFGGAA